MKQILVTGCAGFIGSNFCQLYKDRFKIVGIDCLARGSHASNIPSDIRFYKGNITNAKDVTSILREHPHIEAIVNFAAETHVDHSIADDTIFWTTNVLGVGSLARIAIQNDLRLVQVSTDEVYGHSEGEYIFNETARLGPRNPYAASKVAAELLLLSYHNTYNLDCCITRGTNTIGPRQSLCKAIPKAIYLFHSGQAFPLYRTPARRMWLSVSDHCAAIREVLERGNPGQVYNVSPDEDHEQETGLVIQMVRDIIGRGAVNVVDDRPGYDLRYHVSSERIRNELGWKPESEFAQLIDSTVQWYLQNVEWMDQHAARELL